MTFELQQLILKASQELGSQACFQGKHDWVAEGGRGCPKGYEDNCSQPVYTCRTCGQQDYGTVGGPAYKECRVDCKLPEWKDETDLPVK